MTKLQYLVVGSAVALFLVLYLACETKPPKQSLVEKSRLAQAELIDINDLIRQAHDQLPPTQLGTLQVLEQELSTAESDTGKVSILQRLSGQWYNSNQAAIAGYYAEEAAQLSNTEEAWSITGTTYSICVQREEDSQVRAYCNQHAVSAYQNAISLNPEEVSHKVNLALAYTELPPENEPMKGVLMLRELQEQYPQNVSVLNTLARLGIKTGQFDRALQRLEQAQAIDPDNTNTICLLSQAYAGLGNTEQAAAFAEQCRQARNNQR
jgi:tetratricopeptide (TPR) repeat protein